jgi:H+/Cl- antiporter ClcA
MQDKLSSFIGGVILVVSFISFRDILSAVVLGIIGGYAASCGRWLWKVMINWINKKQNEN